MSTDIIRYKQPPQQSWRDDPQIQATITGVYEILKVKYPKKYQQMQRQKAAIAASQSDIDVIRNDPAFIAEYETLKISLRRKEYGNEYILLSIEPNATKREVYNAYRRKARKMHPDVGGSAEQFKQLQDAYHKLLKVAPKE